MSDTCANCHTAANCNWKLCSHVTAGTFLTCLVCKILLSILYDVAKFLVLCLSWPVPDLLRYELFFCHVLINFSKFRVLCWSHNHFRTIHSLDVRTNFVPSLLCVLWHSHAPSYQVLDHETIHNQSNGSVSSNHVSFSLLRLRVFSTNRHFIVRKHGCIFF